MGAGQNTDMKAALQNVSKKKEFEDVLNQVRTDKKVPTPTQG